MTDKPKAKRPGVTDDTEAARALLERLIDRYRQGLPQIIVDDADVRALVDFAAAARAEGARAERDVLMNLASFVGNGPNEWTSAEDMDARIRDGIERLIRPVTAMRDEWKKRYEGLKIVFDSIQRARAGETGPKEDDRG